MKTYSISELSKLAGVTARTLHHYDDIGLLSPSRRTDKGYRQYERKDLLMLQQILFYKELGFPLKEIKSILQDEGFDRISALKSHKDQLTKRLGNLHRLIETIEKTIKEIKNTKTMKDSEIYEGFTPEEIDTMRKEVSKRWGQEKLEATEQRIQSLGKEGWEDTKKKGEEINQLLADVIGLPPENSAVQQAVALHFRHLNIFYEVSKERYLGLGDLYVEDEKFRAHYEKYASGLAEFLREAIIVFCDNGMVAR